MTDIVDRFERPNRDARAIAELRRLLTRKLRAGEPQIDVGAVLMALGLRTVDLLPEDRRGRT